jgi:LCP family protein required for cell wall assembly
VVALYLAFTFAVRPPEIPRDSDLLFRPPDIPAALSDGAENPTVSQTGDKTRRELCYTFLLIAADDGNGNADTIMVMTYDVKNGKIGVLSVPRDTVVQTTRRPPKINAAYSQGASTVRKELSTMLGIPIDFTICVDMKAFVELVNAVGGVEQFEVPVLMDYDDPMQDLHIHFYPGMQDLNGQQALEVARFRKNSNGEGGYADSDIGRTHTQQALLRALSAKVLAWQNVTKVLQFTDIFLRNVDTNLTVGNMTYFADNVLKLDLKNSLETATLPGDGTKTYKGTKWSYVLDKEESLRLLNELLNPFTTPLTLEDVRFVDAD